MKVDKTKKIVYITSILSTLILLIGTTFSFFTVSNRSKYDAVALEAGKINLSLSITPLYTGRKLIPTEDEEIMLAYKNKCLDYYKRGACHAYEVKISNYGRNQNLIGKINFTIEKIENLSYIILDENEEVYLTKTPVTGETLEFSLGPSFILGDGKESKPSTKKFILVVWLTNLDEDQTEKDAGGTYNASITYESVYGGKLTGSVNGFGDESSNVSELGGNNE